MAKCKIDDAEFDHVMILATAFEENRKNDLKVPWEVIKPEIETLSETEKEILLGLVRNRK